MVRVVRLQRYRRRVLRIRIEWRCLAGKDAHAHTDIVVELGDGRL